MIDTEKEREAFEAWASDDGKWPSAVTRDHAGEYLPSSIAAAWRVWLARADCAEQRVPDGWRLVPIEPTQAMLRPFAGCPYYELSLAWAAALGVAPSAPNVEDAP